MWSLVLLFTVSAYAASCPSYSVNYISGPLSTFNKCYSGTDSSSDESDFCDCLAPLVDSLGGLDCVNAAGGVTTAISAWITSQSNLANQIDQQVSGNHGADFVDLFTSFTSYSTLGSSYNQLSSSDAGGWGNNWIATCGPALGFIFEQWLDDPTHFDDITTIWDTTNAMWDTTLITKNGLKDVNGNVLEEPVTFANGVTHAQEDTFLGSLTYWCWIESNYGDFTHLIPGAFIKNGGMGCYAYRDSEDSSLIKFRLGVNKDFTPVPSSVSFVAKYDLPSVADCPGPVGTNLTWVTVVNTYFSTLIISGLNISNCSSGSSPVLIVSGSCPGQHDITNEVYNIIAAHPDTLPTLDLTVTVNDQAWITKMETSSQGDDNGSPSPNPDDGDAAGQLFTTTAVFVIALASLAYLG